MNPNQVFSPNRSELKTWYDFFRISSEWFRMFRKQIFNWNSIQSNRNYSENFQNLFLSHSKSFQTNSKPIFNLVQCKSNKNHSDSIRDFKPNESKPGFQSMTYGRMNPDQVFSPNPSQLKTWFDFFRISSEWFRMVREQIFNWNSIRANRNYSEKFKNLFLSHSKSFQTNSKPIFNLVRCKSNKNQSDSIRFIPVQFETLNQMNPNQVFSPSPFFSPSPSELKTWFDFFWISSEWFRIVREQIFNWNSIRANENHSESFQNLFPNH